MDVCKILMFREEGIGEDVEAQTCAEDYKGRVQIAKLQKKYLI